MAVEGDLEEMAREKLGCEKKTSYVIWSYSESVINPLPFTIFARVLFRENVFTESLPSNGSMRHNM
jgi:hypothetical protein